MIVIGSTGEQIGTVERFEIDRVGRLKCVVLNCLGGSNGTFRRKRLPVERVTSLRGNVLSVSLTRRDVGALEDVADPAPDLALEAPVQLFAGARPISA